METWDSKSTPKPGGSPASSCTGRISSSKAHPQQQGRPSLRRRAVGAPGARRARRVRRRAPRPRGGGAPLRRPAHRDPGRPGRTAARPGPGLRREGVRSTGHGPPPGRLRDPARPRAGRVAGRRHDQAGVPGRTPGADLRALPRHGAGRLPARPAAQPPLHPGHLGLDLRRRLHQRHALARPAARDGPLRGDLPAPPAVPRRELPPLVRGQADYPPPSRAATSSSSATAPCSSA